METPAGNWFDVRDADAIDTPALIVYTDRVKHNLEVLKSMIDDVGRLRPHVKTHKCREAILLTIAAGIHKFKCATIAEAELLGQCGAKDVLFAYQPTGPKLARFIKIIQTFPQTTFSSLVDNFASVTQLSDAAVKAELQISVYVDLNVGMNRTGIAPGEAASRLYSACALLPGVCAVGFHVYDGHIHDADLQTRINRCNAYFGDVEKLQTELVQKGFPEPVIVASGTPTFPAHAKRANVECSPGTFIYWDKGYQDAFTEQPFLTAALVITRVVSLPDTTKICLDVGHKSVAAENALNKRICFLNAPELTPVGQSEEHLVMEAGEGHTYKIGDLLYGLPYHICPTVALYERAITIENKKINGEWLTTARDRRINI